MILDVATARVFCNDVMLVVAMPTVVLTAPIFDCKELMLLDAVIKMACSVVMLDMTVKIVPCNHVMLVVAAFVAFCNAVILLAAVLSMSPCKFDALCNEEMSDAATSTDARSKVMLDVTVVNASP